MKLNYKTTAYLGIIFLAISLFWQSYDLIIPKVLIDKFGLNQFQSGIVMALDNLIAVILLPIFGLISDKSNHKKGKRTFYIVIGTVLAAFAFMGLSFTDYIQTEKVKTTDIVESHYELAFNDVSDITLKSHWYTVIDAMKNERDLTYANNEITQDAYQSWYEDDYVTIKNILDDSETTLSTRDISKVQDAYYNYLSLRAFELTKEDPLVLFVFIATLIVAIIAMSIYRTPAVALMPDVTIKPLRTEANAIITLMGAIGGVLAVFILMVFGLSNASYGYYTPIFITVGILMLSTLIIFLKNIDEPKLVEKRIEVEHQMHLNITDAYEHPTQAFTKRKRLSLYLLLATIFFIFFSYNAVMSKISDYLPKVLNLEFYQWQFIVAQALIVLSILPMGLLSMILGRKKSMIYGLIMIIMSFGIVAFIGENQIYLTALVVVVAGFGWVLTGVNAYPMVVELSKGDNIGRYTGFYYMASMGAQIITPVLSGLLMDYSVFGRLTLFPYATLFAIVALIILIFVHHGDTQKMSRDDIRQLIESYRDKREK
ncbi:MFS transporter [Mycoplasmatota bacterium]|nr:MFS transporter [Mycoplasmatota bacterium]